MVKISGEYRDMIKEAQRRTKEEFGEGDYLKKLFESDLNSLKATKAETSSQKRNVTKKEYKPTDTELGKAFYALKQIKKKVNQGKPNYEGAFDDLEMFKRISKNLIQKDKYYQPILLANANKIKDLMEESSRTGNKFYGEMKQLSKKFEKGIDPVGTIIATENGKYHYTNYGSSKKRDVLSEEGKEAYRQESTEK